MGLEGIAAPYSPKVEHMREYFGRMGESLSVRGADKLGSLARNLEYRLGAGNVVGANKVIEFRVRAALGYTDNFYYWHSSLSLQKAYGLNKGLERMSNQPSKTHYSDRGIILAEALGEVAERALNFWDVVESLVNEKGNDILDSNPEIRSAYWLSMMEERRGREGWIINLLSSSILVAEVHLKREKASKSHYWGGVCELFTRAKTINSRYGRRIHRFRHDWNNVVGRYLRLKRELEGLRG